MPMKRYLSCLIALFLMLFVSENILAAENELKYTISYENDSISLTTVERNGKPYSEIKMGDLYSSCLKPGQPLLPISKLSFSVPVTATDFKVDIKAEDMEEMTLPYPPCPGRDYRDYFAGQNGSSDEDDKWFSRDVDLIDPNDYTNRPIASINMDFLEGVYRILVVDIEPVQWTQEANRIKVFRKIELKITWRTDESLMDEVIDPQRSYLIKSMIEMAKKRVVNPQDVEKNVPKWALERIRKSVSAISILDNHTLAKPSVLSGINTLPGINTNEL